jgi:predicted dehydrogenase
MPAACRWGILGAADIARKNWKAIRLAGNSTLVAVASRDAAKAATFIAECQSDVPFPTPPVAVGGYDELLRRPDIDAVYIPLPTGIRREWVEKAAAAKKHVLCEKPCGTTSADVRAVLDACKANNVQFMDGVMFMHSGRLPLLRTVLDDAGAVGDIRRVTSQFSFLAPGEFMTTNIRVHDQLEPLGALGDLGWYNIRFSLWVMKYQMPERVTGRTLAEHGTSKTKVPTEFAGDLYYPGGKTASFYCSFLTENQQWAHVSGTKGSVSLADFVLPFYGSEAAFELHRPAFEKFGCSFRMGNHVTRHAVPEYSEGAPNSQEVNMVRTFADLALSGKVDPHWGDIALKTQQVLDACLRSARDGGRPIAVDA